jgi:HK97 family phage major capsid protein
VANRSGAQPKSCVSNRSVSTVIESLRPSLRFPVVQSDAAAAWLAEGDDITETDPSLGELAVTPTKVGAIVKISNES